MSTPLRILLVEDDPDDVWLIRDALARRLPGAFDLRHFDRLEPALDGRAGNDADVALLDLTLPDSVGLETFHRLQAGSPLLPIIVLTGYDDETLALAAVQAGAQDYLIKAQVDDNLLARSLRYAIERSRLSLTEQMLRCSEAKLRVAREIQQRLFPAAAPHVPGCDIAGASFPADATGGDYFDYIPMLGGELGIVIGDVSGHGVGPAFLMVETRACLRSLALTQTDPGEMLGKVNRILADDTDDFHFVTLVLATLCPRSRRFLYASAGHPCYLMEANGAVRRLESMGLPLGVDREAAFPCAVAVDLAPGQLVLLLTDGAFETVSPRDEQFGMERVFATVRAQRQRPACEIVQAIYAAARDFAQQAPQQDDITAVVIKVG